jgi:hypothetical protein
MARLAIDPADQFGVRGRLGHPDVDVAFNGRRGRGVADGLLSLTRHRHIPSCGLAPLACGLLCTKAEPHPVTGQETELKAISVQDGRVALDGDRTIRRWEFRAGDIARYGGARSRQATNSLSRPRTQTDQGNRAPPGPRHDDLHDGRQPTRRRPRRRCSTNCRPLRCCRRGLFVAVCG